MDMFLISTVCCQGYEIHLDLYNTKQYSVMNSAISHVKKSNCVLLTSEGGWGQGNDF